MLDILSRLWLKKMSIVYCPIEEALCKDHPKKKKLYKNFQIWTTLVQLGMYKIFQFNSTQPIQSNLLKNLNFWVRLGWVEWSGKKIRLTHPNPYIFKK